MHLVDKQIQEGDFIGQLEGSRFMLTQTVPWNCTTDSSSVGFSGCHFTQREREIVCPYNKFTKAINGTHPEYLELFGPSCSSDVDRIDRTTLATQHQ